jgi:hypothetical protein
MDYENHPYVRMRLQSMPDEPFAIVDVDAIDVWMLRNPDATTEQVRDATLAPDHVLWSSHPITAGMQPAAILQVQDESGGGMIRVVELVRA